MTSLSSVPLASFVSVALLNSKNPVEARLMTAGFFGAGAAALPWPIWMSCVALGTGAGAGAGDAGAGFGAVAAGFCACSVAHAARTAETARISVVFFISPPLFYVETGRHLSTGATSLTRRFYEGKPPLARVFCNAARDKI